ncbi:MAG TPA: PDDEXK nuclease domain-containing protein [Bacteroidia bacterium]|nr:PDDEXK nuclease domain-containing protein [Bacteroidia bacterium]
MAGKTIKTGVGKLFDQAIELIRTARNQAARQTNSLMVFTYFHLGRLIIEHEQGGKVKADYGKETIKELSKKLTEHFGDGFSERNLEQMRLFYSLYRSKMHIPSISQTPSAKSLTAKKSQTSSAKSPALYTPAQHSRKSLAEIFPLSWSQYVLLCRIKDSSERQFYEIETIQNNWSVRELQRQFESDLYVRLALSKNKKQVKQLAQKGQVIEKPEDVLKSPYVLEFLGLESKPAYSESDLESAIINKIEHFLLEMGKGFLFGGRQVRFSFDGEDFFVDLVLYNRLLQCFVLVDLKIGKLKHQDIGQMQMYVNYYDRYVRKEYEKPTIGIVICKDKSDAVVEITLPKGNKTIFAKEYKLYLPTKGELKKVLG